LDILRGKEYLSFEYFVISSITGIQVSSRLSRLSHSSIGEVYTMVKTGRSKQASLLLRPRLIKEFNIQHCFILFRGDEKFGRCEWYVGPTSDFKEKEGFKPNVKLDYIDDDGHVLNAKEACRLAQIIYEMAGCSACCVMQRKRDTQHNKTGITTRH
jgi:hypothetical protein